MNIEITSVSSRDGGALVCVAVRISNGENSEMIEFLLLPSQLAELGLSAREISEETFDEINAAAELCSAFRKGLSALGYGAYSKKELVMKLCHKGVTREMANGAADLLEQMGYVNEAEDAARLAERSVKKFWGARRISSELYAKGYSPDAVAWALASLESVDFAALCEDYIRKKYKSIPDSPEGRKKLFSALMRMGYTSSEIKEAFRAF